MGFIRKLFDSKQSDEKTKNTHLDSLTKKEQSNFNPEDYIRKKLQELFNDSVSDFIRENGLSDPMLDGLKVQGVIASVYQQMKDNGTMIALCSMKNISSERYNEILEEECTNALSQFLM